MSARPVDLPRIPELDGVRGCAIALVLLWHYVAEQIHAPLQSGPGRIAQVLGLTWSGVDLFFVLSGFLIAGILLDHRGAENYFRVFYVRRVCRIFPLYFLLLGLFVVMGLAGFASDPRFRVLFEGPTPPLWSYALFAQNFFMGVQDSYGAGWLGVTWSLAVEEQFYLVLPLVVFFLPSRWLPAGLLAAVLCAPILRGLTGGLTSFVGMPWRMDSLLAGALLAWAVRRPGFVEMAGRQRATLRILLVVLLGGAALLTWKKHAFGVFDHTWLAALYASFILLPLVAREGWLAAVLRWPPLGGLGKISYGVYMFHQPISGLVHGWLREAAPEMADARGVGITFLALGLTLGAALLSYYLLEQPIFRYGHTFRYAPAPTARPADAFSSN
jgi:peptidoglycan/LPS O-acetylase OafA/YrhL